MVEVTFARLGAASGSFRSGLSNTIIVKLALSNMWQPDFSFNFFLASFTNSYTYNIFEVHERKNECSNDKSLQLAINPRKSPLM